MKLENKDEVIRVGIADAKISRSKILKTYGLGSCVGAAIYDLNNELAGMAHIMLPDSAASREKQLNRNKYADTALTDLVKALEMEGGNKTNFKAKIAGGSQMFQFSNTNPVIRIGQRNVEAVIEILSNLNIPIISKDVGGNYGRTMEFNPVNGMMIISTAGKGKIQL